MTRPRGSSKLALIKGRIGIATRHGRHRTGLPPQRNAVRHAEAHIRKESNVHDLVERAAARHGIPRLELWHEVASALVGGMLAIQHNLSERLHPEGPTLGDWLAGFHTAIAHYNDPNPGTVRILRNIRVSETDFEAWFRKTKTRKENTRRGPPPGATTLQEQDRKAFKAIERLMKERKARSPYGAALLLASKLAGIGTHETRAKRVASLYRKERGKT